MRFNVVVAGLLVVGTVGCRDLSVPPVPDVNSFLTGRAVVAVPGSSQSQAVQGADLSVLGSNVHVVSDAQGGFTLGPLPAGEYQLLAVARGDHDARHQRLVSGVQTTAGATRSLGDVLLAENAQLGGRVLVQGQSQGNAGVLVFVPGTDFVTNTSDTGTWLLADLPAGVLRASAFRAGFEPATTSDVTVQGGVVTSIADLLLFPESASAPQGSISGTVVVMGAPNNAGVTVAVTSFATQAEVAHVVTDATGAFALKNLPSDLYTLTASLAGYGTLRLPNLAIGAGVDLTLAGVLVLAPPGAANTPSDGGLGESTFVDAGADAGQPDAGSTDAGSTDAGPPDAGPSDAGQPDAGQSADGGFVGECLTEAQCAAGLLCVNHACVNCSATAACAAGSSCHGGVCLLDCATNATCPDGQVCRGGSCGACQTSAECLDPALICDATGACTHCQNRSQCPSGKACFASGCGTCTLDSDCGAGSLCEQGVCLTGNCHTNQGCPTTQSCVSHTCTTCGQDTDCRAGQLCLSGACVVGDCRGAADCNAGQLCRNNLCGACANDVDCGAGSLCLSTGAGLLCQPGVCRTNVDCVGSNAGEVCNAAHQCVPCATRADCADATKICDPTTSRCVTGNCAAAADCTTLGLAGEVCLSNTCAPCTLDTQCAAGQLCFSGRCKAGTCKDNTWCAGGTQLCELTTTNPVAAPYTCRPCAPVATLNNADCGGTNRVCTATGTCRTGTCLTASQCGGQLACVNNACTACAADADCGGNGLLCVNARCVTGTCHGTGTDPNVDCPATQVCANNLCVGNCRTNADCAGTAANPGTNFCDVTTTHACVPCTSTNQCGGAATGKVCASGACVVGACTITGATPNDTPCGTGLSCVANQCVQVGPLPVTPTPYTEPLPVTAASMVVSGGSQLYYSSIDSAGSFSLALDGSRAKVWRVSDSASTSRPVGPLNGGLVLPAPGFPQGELFLSPSGAGTVIAHRADTGAPAWTISGSTAMSAVSMVGGVPQFVRADNLFGISSVALVRADGTHQRSISLSGCGGNLNMLVAGTSFVYAICYNAVYGIDPINDVISWVFPVSLSNSQTFALVWRPAGLTGAAAGDLLVTTATAGNSTLLGLFVPDFTGGPVVPTAHLNYANFASVALNPVIDPAGALYLYLGGSTPKLTKVSLLDGSTLATVTLPVSPTTMNLAGDGTLVVTSPIAGGLYALSGITITNGSPGTATLKWQVGSATFSVAPGIPAFSTVPAIAPGGGTVSGGVIDMLTANSTGVSQELSALAAPGPSFLYGSPQWGVAGDPGNRSSAPGFDCTTNANCGANQLCVLNRCIGTCRTASTCAAGQGCVLANCGPCPIDSACRAGEVCNAGVCLACNRATNPSCCATNAECGTGACVQGLCRPMPSTTASGAWLRPLTAQNTSAFAQVQGTDGTIYVLDQNSPPSLHAFASDGTVLWTSSAAPSGPLGGSLPMVVRLPGQPQDTLFMLSNAFNTLVTATISPSAFGGWKSVAMTGLSVSATAMAQGVSSVPATKTALYLSGGGKLWAIDAVAAAAGTFSVIWQQPNTGCTEPGTSGGNWVLVGSDATVYHVCADGSVQAWHPDGQGSQPAGLTRPGTLLFTSTPAVAYSASPAPRPAMAAIAGQPDVLYLSQGAVLSSSVLRLSAAGLASRTEVAANANVGFVVDGQGNGLAFSSATSPNYAALTPAGTIAATQSGVYGFGAGGYQNLVMTTDGLVWFVDQKSSPFAVVGLQVNSLATPTQAVRFLAQGGLPWDSATSVGFVPGVTGGTLLLDDNLTGLGYPNRMFTGTPVPSSSAGLTTWGAAGGDAQHRASLKVQ